MDDDARMRALDSEVMRLTRRRATSYPGSVLEDSAFRILLLLVAVTLVTPKTLTKEQRKLLEQLAEIEDVDFSDESFIDKVRNIFG